jgi:hypothetical protein
MGWLIAILMFFVPPLIVLQFLDRTEEFCRSVAFYIGWIPGNIVACGYLGYTTGSFINFISLLIFCQVIQVLFIYYMASLLVRMFGEQAFRPRE